MRVFRAYKIARWNYDLAFKVIPSLFQNFLVLPRILLNGKYIKAIQ